MQVLATWSIRHRGEQRRIELLLGDLSCLPPEHAVDVLVVSAFANDYLPTPTSLIGSLNRVGLSVADLARDKQIDMRAQFSCWLSKRVDRIFNFRQILCIESGWLGTTPENVDDLFRALAPFLLTDLPNSSVAMPLIRSGDARESPTVMLDAILQAAVAWIGRGLKLSVLKIVIYQPNMARECVDIFNAARQRWDSEDELLAADRNIAQPNYHVFISYARPSASMADFIVTSLSQTRRNLRVFVDRTGLQPGRIWLTDIATALDASKRVVILHTPSYWNSNNCKSELNAALTRQNDSGDGILFPLLLEDVTMPYLFRNLQYLDCRLNDKTKVSQACTQLAESFE